MSTFYRTSKRCTVCKTKSEQTVIGSTNTFGSPDLDLRPPEMRRSTMYYWPEKCPHCGFVSYDLEQKTAIRKKWLESEAYTTCEGHSFISDLAAMFYKIYMIAKETNDSRDAFNALMNAAWASDDCSDTENALLCRRMLLPYLEQEIAKDARMAETLTIARADVLRRAELFDQVIEEYSGKVFSEDLLNEICQFQIEKAKQKDADCYRVCDVHPGN